MAIVRIGIDIAKLVFQLHGVDDHGKAVLRKTLSRSEMLNYFAKLPGCLIGLEACAGAHYWARELTRLGHDVRLIAAQFVTPYRKSGKNDANDAQAICEAVGRPNMRFVPVKLVASVGDGKLFRNGREFAAWLGLTPKQYSSGGKSRLGRITKRGDIRLRTLLVQGTRSAMRSMSKRTDAKSRWVADLQRRSHNNVAAVALAARNARTVWAMLARGTEYRVGA